MPNRNLNASESRFRTVMDKMLEGIQIYDKNWNCLYVNDAVVRQGPYSKEQILKCTLMGNYPGIEDTELFHIFEQCRIGKTARHIEYEFSFPDASKKWFELSIQANDDEVLILSIDITERKNAEEKLLKLNKQLSLSQEIAKVGYWEMDLVNDAHYWSDEMYHLFERNKEDGVPDSSTFLMQVHADDRQAVQDSFRGIIQSTQTVEVEFRLNSRDGSIRYFYSTGYKMVVENEKVFRVNGTTQDVTRQKRYEHEIIKEKNLSDSIINSMPGAFYFYDTKGKFLRWNSNFEKVSKYTGEEISQMHPLDFFQDAEKELLRSKIQTVFANGEADVEAGFRTKDDVTIPYSFTGKTVNYGGDTFLIGLGIDISERAKADQAIKEYSEQLRQLAAHLQEVREEERIAISREIHDELGQQLTGLKMDLYWLKSEFTISDEVRKYIDHIVQLTDSSINTVRAISSALRPFILDDLGLIEAIKSYSADFQNRYGIKVCLNLEVTELHISSKIAIGLFRIFQESLTNVARHANASLINIGLKKAENQLFLDIEDDGSGFDMGEVIKKRTLGLIGMKERTLMMNGKFDIDSRPGKGTHFSVIIPFNDPEE